MLLLTMEIFAAAAKVVFPFTGSSQTYLGCYREKLNVLKGLYQKDLIDKELVELPFAMTVDFCIER